MTTLDPQLLRVKESFRYVAEITKPFGTLDHVIDWCKQNMQAEWRWQLIQVSSDRIPGSYIFYFDSEQDYCVFLLKWGG